MELQLPEINWQYEMRRDMQEIVPGLFLGPYAVAGKTKLQYLQQHGITHIVCVRSVMEQSVIKMNFPEHFKYLDVTLEDSVTQLIIPILPAVKDFIDNCIREGGKVLVHSNAGLNRGMVLVIGYVMETFETTCELACQIVARRRFCEGVSRDFLRQLVEYECIYPARRKLNEDSPMLTERVKRGQVEVDVDEMLEVSQKIQRIEEKIMDYDEYHDENIEM